MIKAVIFDLDGTLLYTLKGLSNACNMALEKMGQIGRASSRERV